ncbi:iron complex outermembrane receptor protein [Rhodopseudomonas thermotolerans]|uniref:Iron complex outermembrane recepter protein n=2 Tax=Rhodopseudomonas TaxID=1073 RepID=A0A336JPA5_9BRAD|nr:iron complex outermembrane receptor protein [Rhodopseudomonas pentothenatexigens]REF94045.1 iron complex outermembrane receptor protein [Rhodopseudomonas thermotolerans]SSW91372.1 iron complex outermembrane recepter protein [Rhodopseudomonas pentothenatexigens]
MMSTKLGRFVGGTALRALLRSTALGAGLVGLGLQAGTALAQSSRDLPAVTVDAPKPQAARSSKPPRRASRPVTAARRTAAPSRQQVAEPPVRAAGLGRGAERADGPVTGYLANQSATGTKTDTPILSTPQSISVVTQDQIQAQGAQNVVEALRYTPGVTLDTYGATTFFDSFKLRGFDVPRYLDGLRLPVDPGTQFAFPRIETYGLERIEVLRGPSSGLYGQTDPGGLLNMVSKRPTAYSQHEIIGSFGSFERFQGAFDSSGPIDRNGEFLYRIVGLGRSTDGQQDFVHEDKAYIAPSLTWRPTADTSLTILSHYSHIRNDGWQQYVPGGLSLRPGAFGRVPYSRYLGEPGRDGYTLDQFSVGYAFEHRFDNNLQFRSNLRYFDVSQDLAGVRAEGLLADDRTVPRSYNYVKSSAKNLALDNQIQADFATGPLLHKVLAGFDYQRQDSNSDYRFTMIGSIDAFAPAYGGFVPPAASVAPFIATTATSEQAGLYLQDQVKYDGWTLTLTGRQDWANARTVSTALFPAAGTYLQNDKATTGRVGLNYLFDFGLSPYVNYSSSFVPTSGTDQFGNTFKPTTGEGGEIGVKFKPLGSNLMLTAAVFEINQKNVLTPDPTNIIFSVQTGGVRVRGFEFEARGNVTRELEIVGGYNKYDPRVTSSNSGTAGNYLLNTALEQASLWAKYTWYNGPVAGLGIGGGVRYVGKSYGDAANTVLIPSYALFDASISYDLQYLRPDLKGWSMQVNATNLGNRYYVSSCVTSLTYCGLGAARTVIGTLKYAWN